MKNISYTWRDLSALAAILLTLIACLPIFLCMAPWVDATFYDICARIIQRGGVLYRDSFDTNLPGMAWLHLTIRSLFGWRSEVIRAADFVVVAGIICLLVRWFAAMPRHGRIWMAATLLFYYFSTSEWCQNQRDVWMLLPCLAALYLRRQQLFAFQPAFPWAVLEGLLWGSAVWIKPMAAAPALACWLFGIVWRCRTLFTWRALLVETAGLLMGGLLCGGAGAFWLWRSGAWTPFWDIMLNWNPEYQDHFMRWTLRWRHFKFWCVTSMPWCLVHLAALPLAGISLIKAIRNKSNLSLEHLSQGLLAILYLSWIAQVLLFQGWYPYHWTPSLLLALMLIAARIRIPTDPGWRFALAFHVLLFFGLTVFTHPGLRPTRLACWWKCATEGSTNRLKDQLALTPQQGVTGGATDWEDLESVEVFLRSQELTQNDILCLHEATMPLYQELNRVPPVRYLFYGQAIGVYRAHRQQMLEELSTSQAKYAVSDLTSIGWHPYQTQPSIPFSKPMTEAFPWSEPIVFRSGRYTVHRLDKPIRKLWP